MNTWNTLPESCQQMVYNSTPATVMRQIQQAENPTLAEVISTEAARVDYTILLDNLTSEVALEDPGIGSTDPNITIDNNCADDELHFEMPWGSDDYDDAGDEIDDSDVSTTASRRGQAATELERFDLRTSDVDRYEGEDGDNADADEEEESSQADDGSTQNLEDWWHSTRECEDWTVYFRPVKYDNGEANAMSSDISEAKTQL